MADLYANIDLGSQYGLGLVPLTQSQVDYFGIAAGADDAEVRLISRSAHTKSVYDGPNDGAGRQINVPEHKYQYLPGTDGGRGGKAIRVPTKRETTAGNTRMTTIRFPQKASIVAIGKFLKDKTTANKPDYFITPAGRRYPVTGVVFPADPNPAT